MTAVARVFDWKVRGFRWVEIIGVALVAVMALSVYTAKTAAAREGARIAELERDIAVGTQRVRLLRAEVARLEQPARLEALSRMVGLEPVDVHRRVVEGDLAELAPAPQPEPVPMETTVVVPAPVAITIPTAAHTPPTPEIAR